MKTKSLIFLALWLALPCASARTIDWGNSVDDTLLDSHGMALDASYTFELGTFGSFVPDFTNIEQWAANWKVFDRATESNGKWTPADGYFSSTVDLLETGMSSASPPLPGFTFAENEQAYIWVFNTQTLAVGTTEWALVTNDSGDGNALDNWLMPAPTDHSVLPLNWNLTIASHVKFGGLNDVQGPGTYTPPGVGFELQTHTISVIPEPSGALLMALAGLVFQLRRRSRRA